MEQYSIIILLLSIFLAVAAFAPSIKLPYPILMILAGIIAGLFPEFDGILINPEVIFLIFLPPLLSDAAFNIPYNEFKANIKIISTMAFLLVFITTIGIAAITHYMLPEISWSLAFVLGAILSPPDAVAASAIAKDLKISHRTYIILEGESLVNDASALIAYRLALAAVAGTAFVLWKAGLLFIITISGGFLIGFTLWYGYNFILKKTKLDDKVIMSLGLLLPFVTYLLAEELHVSGVISVVIIGLLTAVKKDTMFSDTVKEQSKTIWGMIVFLLNGLVFILIGIEFPRVIKDVPDDALLYLIICAFLIFLTALFIRIIVIFTHKFRLDKQNIFLGKSAKKNDSPGWKEILIISWSGMRGIVSLATALALPVTLSNGEAFPQRDNILFLTIAVVIIMMLIQGMGLPLLIRWLRVDADQTINLLNDHDTSVN